METLLKMLNVFSWIAVIGCPLLIALKIWLEYRYEGSLEQMLDRMEGQQTYYTGGLGKLLLIFIIALVYLIVS